MSYDIIGIGYSATDYLGVVPKFPEIDTKTKISELTVQGGGVTATAMVAAARLGAKVSFVAPLGDDAFGKFTKDELYKENVDTNNIVIRPGSLSPFSFIAIDEPTGRRNIFWSRSGLEPLRPEEIDRAHILSAKVLHVDNHETLAATQAAKWANEAKIPVLMDAGSMKPGVPDLLEYVNILISSEQFAGEMCGQVDPMDAARLMRKGRTTTSIVTCGNKGCFCVTGGEEFHIPAFKVDVVDTTGAGDVFHGAFSFGVSKGWEIKTIAIFASAVAAIKCTKIGGRDGIPNFNDTLMFLRSHGHNIL